MSISTLSEFRSFVKTMLGNGPSNSDSVINVEISTTQLNTAIQWAVDHMRRYLGGEALIEDYMTLNLLPGVSAYDLSGADVSDIIDFQTSFGSGSISTLFTPLNLLTGGNIEAILGTGGSMSLVGYVIALNYLEQVEDLFSIKYHIDYRELRESLIVVPTPTVALVGLLKVWKKETSERLYNHVHTQRLALARSKQIWGISLSKMDVTFAGGGSVVAFGREMLSQGREEEKEVIQLLKDEGEQFGVYFG